MRVLIADDHGHIDATWHLTEDGPVSFTPSRQQAEAFLPLLIGVLSSHGYTCSPPAKATPPIPSEEPPTITP